MAGASLFSWHNPKQLTCGHWIVTYSQVGGNGIRSENFMGKYVCNLQLYTFYPGNFDSNQNVFLHEAAPCANYWNCYLASRSLDQVLFHVQQ